METRIKREDNGKNGRFAIYENGTFAGEMTFTRIDDTTFSIDHTGVEEAFAGKDYAKKMRLEAVANLRNNGLKIIPICPYVKKMFRKNENIRDVLAQ